MKEALFYKKIAGKIVQCLLCPHYCTLKPGERGKCGVRENKDGKLISLVYGKLCSLAIDPIEKKPLYHFLPGEKALSIATVGCNLHCKYCQNWEISQASPEDVISLKLKPEDVVNEAIKRNIKIISFTYTEPTIFYEYMIDIAKISKEKGIKNVIVSNGFINPDPLTKLIKHIDGANIDLKSIDNNFYVNLCDARLDPVLETLKILYKEKVWLEITNLIIPGFNDKKKDILKLIRWIKNNLGRDVPLHFSAFYPHYKMIRLHPTPSSTLIEARKTALKEGLHYVYTGNIIDEEGAETRCPYCDALLIKRKFYNIIENNVKEGKCPVCKKKIAGVWE